MKDAGIIELDVEHVREISIAKRVEVLEDLGGISLFGTL